MGPWTHPELGSGGRRSHPWHQGSKHFTRETYTHLSWFSVLSERHSLSGIPEPVQYKRRGFGVKGMNVLFLPGHLTRVPRERRAGDGTRSTLTPGWTEGRTRGAVMCRGDSWGAGRGGDFSLLLETNVRGSRRPLLFTPHSPSGVVLRRFPRGSCSGKDPRHRVVVPQGP